MLIVPVKRSGGQKCDPRTRRGVASPPTGARACTAKARRAQRARVRERPGVSLLSLPMLLRPSGQSEHGEAPRSLALVSPCQADGSPSLSLLAFSLNLFCLSAFPGDIRRHTCVTCACASTGAISTFHSKRKQHVSEKNLHYESDHSSATYLFHSPLWINL